MVFLPQELWEKREAELDLLTELLRRERSRIAGAWTFTMDDMRGVAEDTVLDYHLADARKNYIYYIFGVDPQMP